MIERLIEFSVRRPGFVIGLALVLATLGAYAAYETPVDAVPDLSENQVLVFTDWPGHSPREIEDQITCVLSANLQSLDGLRVVRGSSEVGFSIIHLIFEDGTDFRTAHKTVQERVGLLGDQLPPGVTPRLAADAIPTGQIFWYTVEGAGYDLAKLRSVQDWYVRRQLESVSGVAEVASVGGQVAEYHIDIDPDRMQARGAALRDVLTEVSRANATVGGAVVHKGNAEFIVRETGQLGNRPLPPALQNGSESVADKPVSEDASHREAALGASSSTVITNLERVLVPTSAGAVPLAEIARISLGTRSRRGILERDGNEVVGGVVLMRYGENPLEVTRRLKAKIRELQVGLPKGVRILPMYDRTPLINGAIGTVTGTLIEAMLTAAICVAVILRHFRASLVIVITLPLAALSSFAIMWGLRKLGLADIQTNIMSLAGIAISIGVLVDSSIVMAENVMHQLREKFGDEPVRGDIRHIVLPACRMVGRPIFFSVLIMLISFLPVFALGGIDGKMYRPLAFTKSFALFSVAILAVTLVPALCTFLIRGRMRSETDSWIVRSVMDVYRPTLVYLLDQPGWLVWVLSATLIAAMAPLGIHALFLAALFASIGITPWVWQTRRAVCLAVGSLVLVALVADQNMRPLGVENRMPLDEGMVMDMPITIPRASVVQSGDDLKARDMLLCRFPEVEMVLGKAGRAESPFDPAPLDMIETMVNFRPQSQWPKRKLREADAERQARDVYAALLQSRLIAGPAGQASPEETINEAVMAALPRFDAIMRETGYQRNLEFDRELRSQLVRHLVETTIAAYQRHGRLTRAAGPGDIAAVAGTIPPEVSSALVVATEPPDYVEFLQAAERGLGTTGLLTEAATESAASASSPGWLSLSRLWGDFRTNLDGELCRAAAAFRRKAWAAHVTRLNHDLYERAVATYTHLIVEEILQRSEGVDPQVAAVQQQIQKARVILPATAPVAGAHHGGRQLPLESMRDPCPPLDTLLTDLTQQFSKWVLLWQRDRQELNGFGGELDRVMQMPGWTNVWTMPIQNRVDMLATGVNTEIGVRVLGRNLEDVVNASDEIARVLRNLPGAADVISDPIRGKGYLEIHPDSARAAAAGVSVGDIHETVETALGGKQVTTVAEGHERSAVRVRFAGKWSQDEQSVGQMPIPVMQGGRESGPHGTVPLAQLADVRTASGPATIKSENGSLRNYVRLNVRGRSASSFVEEGRRAIAEQVRLPEGVFVEWTGQYEHMVETTRTLMLLVPLALGAILLLLYLTYHDWSDACLMLLAIPGALAGGILFQWLFGYKFSVPVAVGYIACLGMATSTGIIMLVYLREAVEKAGGLDRLTLPELRAAVVAGAAQRLRPKLLTEGTTILGLAPMLWATGVGAEIIRPMAAPVMGGILIADEVIDLMLPVLFYWVRVRRLKRLQKMQAETPIEATMESNQVGVLS